MKLELAFILLSVFFTISSGKPEIKDPIYLETPETTCEHIQTIVDYHNELRMLLANGTLKSQPKAANMQKIVWDPILAETAENYSKKMIFEHNPNIHDDRFDAGENIFLSGSNKNSSNIEWKRAIDSWFNEHRLYKFKPASKYDALTGHYTQMIWSDTIYVGCGVTFFYDRNRKWMYKIYVCNYGPRGNWIGQYPYAEDSGEEWLLASLLLPEFFEIPTCDKLCCDFKQCGVLYSANCLGN